MGMNECFGPIPPLTTQLYLSVREKANPNHPGFVSPAVEQDHVSPIVNSSAKALNTSSAPMRSSFHGMARYKSHMMNQKVVRLHEAEQKKIQDIARYNEVQRPRYQDASSNKSEENYQDPGRYHDAHRKAHTVQFHDLPKQSSQTLNYSEATNKEFAGHSNDGLAPSSTKLQDKASSDLEDSSYVDEHNPHIYNRSPFEDGTGRYIKKRRSRLKGISKKSQNLHSNKNNQTLRQYLANWDEECDDVTTNPKLPDVVPSNNVEPVLVLDYRSLGNDGLSSLQADVGIGRPADSGLIQMTYQEIDDMNTVNKQSLQNIPEECEHIDVAFQEQIEEHHSKEEVNSRNDIIKEKGIDLKSTNSPVDCSIGWPYYGKSPMRWTRIKRKETDYYKSHLVTTDQIIRTLAKEDHPDLLPGTSNVKVCLTPKSHHERESKTWSVVDPSGSGESSHWSFVEENNNDLITASQNAKQDEHYNNQVPIVLVKKLVLKREADGKIGNECEHLPKFAHSSEDDDEIKKTDAANAKGRKTLLKKRSSNSSRVPETCQVCGSHYKDKAEKIEHVKEHLYHCQQCHIAFNSKKELESNSRQLEESKFKFELKALLGEFVRHRSSRHPRTKEQHHCLLCQRTFPTLQRHQLHLSGHLHRHLETAQRRTIHTLFRLFTGNDCPALTPLSEEEASGVSWFPAEGGAIHFYHQAPPLQIAVQLHLELPATIMSSATLWSNMVSPILSLQILNLEFPGFSSLVYCESSTLDHVDTKTRNMFSTSPVSVQYYLYLLRTQRNATISGSVETWAEVPTTQIYMNPHMMQGRLQDEMHTRGPFLLRWSLQAEFLTSSDDAGSHIGGANSSHQRPGNGRGGGVPKAALTRAHLAGGGSGGLTLKSSSHQEKLFANMLPLFWKQNTILAETPYSHQMATVTRDTELVLLPQDTRLIELCTNHLHDAMSHESHPHSMLHPISCQRSRHKSPLVTFLFQENEDKDKNAFAGPSHSKR
uniref:C2H2-type domain-containing protein n=1 Tax=Timema shepardi TaxID=629360 RepID=A0A7R9FVI2_TIMSH|nr:unnamed protein product [Timema shepardi]